MLVVCFPRLNAFVLKYNKITFQKYFLWPQFSDFHSKIISALCKSIFILFSNVTHESIMLSRYNATLFKVVGGDEADLAIWKWGGWGYSLYKSPFLNNSREGIGATLMTHILGRQCGWRVSRLGPGSQSCVRDIVRDNAGRRSPPIIICGAVLGFSRAVVILQRFHKQIILLTLPSCAVAVAVFAPNPPFFQDVFW